MSSPPVPDACPFRKGVDYQARADICSKGGLCEKHYLRAGGGGEYLECPKFSKWFWTEAAKGKAPKEASR